VTSKGFKFTHGIWNNTDKNCRNEMAEVVVSKGKKVGLLIA